MRLAFCFLWTGGADRSPPVRIKPLRFSVTHLTKNVTKRRCRHRFCFVFFSVQSQYALLPGAYAKNLFIQMYIQMGVSHLNAVSFKLFLDVVHNGKMYIPVVF